MSEYKYVTKKRRSGRVYWTFSITIEGERYYSPPYKEERDAALGADKYLISKGKSPVNILKPKYEKI